MDVHDWLTQPVNLHMGHPAEEDGCPTSQDGCPADGDGHPTSQDGCPIGEDGRPVGEDGHPITNDGRPINEASEDGCLMSERMDVLRPSKRRWTSHICRWTSRYLPWHPKTQVHVHLFVLLHSMASKRNDEYSTAHSESKSDSNAIRSISNCAISSLSSLLEEWPPSSVSSRDSEFG
jgi:hypothetical protein